MGIVIRIIIVVSIISVVVIAIISLPGLVGESVLRIILLLVEVGSVVILPVKGLIVVIVFETVISLALVVILIVKVVSLIELILIVLSPILTVRLNYIGLITLAKFRVKVLIVIAVEPIFSRIWLLAIIIVCKCILISLITLIAESTLNRISVLVSISSS